MERIPTVKAAVVQYFPILFNLQATDEKVIRSINEVVQKGTQVIFFPEVYIPVYPCGLTFGTVVGKRRSSGRRLWQHYWSNCVNIPSNTTAAYEEAANEANAFVSMGMIERDSSSSNGILYCTI